MKRAGVAIAVLLVVAACAATKPAAPTPPATVVVTIEEPTASPAPGVCEQLRNDSNQPVRITVEPAQAPKAAVTFTLQPGQSKAGGVCQLWANLP